MWGCERVIRWCLGSNCETEGTGAMAAQLALRAQQFGVQWSNGFFYRSRIGGSWRHVMEVESRSKENGYL